MGIIEIVKNELINYSGFIIVLLAFNVLDIISAIPDILEEGYSSSKMRNGLVGKLCLYVVLIVALGVDYVCSANGNIFKTATLFFIANEGISILENLEGHVAMPSFLSKLLHGIKDENDVLEPEDRDEGIGC